MINTEKLGFRRLSNSEIQQHIDNIIEDGYSVIKSYIDVDFCAEYKNLLDQIYLKNQENLEYFKTSAPIGFQNVIKNDRMVNNLVAYDPRFLTLSTLGDHLEILKFFLNDPYYGLIPQDDPNFILAQMNARAGIVGLPFHVDSRMVTGGYSSWSMQGYLAIEDLNKFNGGLMVIPKSHKSGIFPTKETTKFNEAVSLETKSGDFVLFSSQLHHATTEILKVEKPSWSILLTYRCWWCKQQFNLLSFVRSDIYRALSSNQKLILGAASVPSSEINASSSSRNGYSNLWDPS